MSKRVFLIVLDSFGIGALPDAADFGDIGADTLGTVSKSGKFIVPNLTKLGFFNIEGVTPHARAVSAPLASYARLAETSKGKDTTIGHWEIAGVQSQKPLPTYPNGFPDEVIKEFERLTGKKTVCNKPYSGTDVIRDYGDHHMRTGDLIVYTSADSVFQVAANEAVVPLETLYNYCQTARDLLKGEHGVGRVIARPFEGTDSSNFKRTANRHDFSIDPPRKTLLDFISEAGKDVIGVGKIYDIFNGHGITEKIKSTDNIMGMQKTVELAGRDFSGMAFINLVDFDMLYGHRNNVDGYASAAADFDKALDRFLPLMREDDILIITADHGCDPGFAGTDHTREYVPMLIYGANIRSGVDLKTRSSYSDIAATVAEYLEVDAEIAGSSYLSEVLRRGK